MSIPFVAWRFRRDACWLLHFSDISSGHFFYLVVALHIQSLETRVHWSWTSPSMCLSWQRQRQHKSRGRWKCKRDPHPQNQEEREEGWGEWRGNWNVNARYNPNSPIQSKVSIRLYDLIPNVISPFSLSYYYTLIMQSEINFLCHVYALIGVKQGKCTCSITLCWHMTAEQKHPESLSQAKRASRDNITIDSHCAPLWKPSFHFNLYKLFMAPQKEDIVINVTMWALIITLSPC